MPSDLVDRLDKGDPRALPRLLTLVENNDPRGVDALERLYPRSGRAHVVGVTGPPGSGKSTLTAALVAALREQGERVAVLAIDPSSPISGGAVLGDRIRMMERHGDPDLFVRSMAARGQRGGLAPAAARAVHVLDAAGFPTIVVETVGTGQDGIDVASLAHTVVVVQVPGLGDGVQAIKAGQLEIGDVLVVNKSDLPGAGQVLRLLRQDVGERRRPDGWNVPVLAASGTRSEGIEEVLSALRAHAVHLRSSNGWSLRVRERAVAEVLAGVRAEFERRLRLAREQDGLAVLIDDVANRRRSPERAIADVVSRLPGPPADGRSVGDEGGG
ncbi:MAG TPA: methylmalonyl Co-A mutase-associated GTPase MeaB [Thermomicrobiales bacterium]|nr:methylmalonyl Co-A mutase-associated GTPase MeaB [Thermomicrobiales bacterium]